MKSRTISKTKTHYYFSKYTHNKSDKGFTLIEAIVVIAIIGAIFAVYALIDSNAFTRQSISSEEATIVSVLQKARSRAMNNINHTEHGVHIETGKYVIFEGTSYGPDVSSNEAIDGNDKFTPDTGGVDGLGTNDVYFSQLSGKPSATGEIKLDDGVNTKIITIVKSGLIDW